VFLPHYFLSTELVEGHVNQRET